MSTTILSSITNCIRHPYLSSSDFVLEVVCMPYLTSTAKSALAVPFSLKTSSILREIDELSEFPIQTKKQTVLKQCLLWAYKNR